MNRSFDTQLKDEDPNALVSIIIPCYNQAEYLPDTLESVFNQTYQNWECIIVNDGSTDHTENIANEWCERDKRFNYLNKVNGGLSSARNAGLKITSGDWIQFLDADDLLPDKRFELLIQKICDLTDIEIIVSNFNLLAVDKLISPYCILKQEYLNLESIILKWDIDFTIPIHCGLFKSELFKTTLFNENLAAKEDWYMWASLFSYHPKAFYINESLAIYRINEKSMSRDENSQFIMLKNEFKALLFIKELLVEEGLSKKLIEVRLDQFVDKIKSLNNTKNQILNSNSYRLGNFLLKPFSFLKSKIND